MSKRGVTLLLVVTSAIAIGALALDIWLARTSATQLAEARAQASQISDLAERINALEPPASIARLDTFRTAAVGVGLLFVLGVAIFLGRSATPRGTPSTTQMLRDLPPPVKPAGATASGTVAAPQPAAPAPHAPASHMGRPANLSAAAELCVDLARVMDTDDVPALLERTATLLDARGLIVWAIDADGAQLRPSLSHGYSEKVLNKLRSLQVDSDNVTSLAFRSLQPQAMNGASVTDSAAIAIPLLTGSGCVGVMAAELKHNRPPADLMPIARIVGAQFSALVAPIETPGLKTARG